LLLFLFPALPGDVEAEQIARAAEVEPLAARRAEIDAKPDGRK
jgi:hypothetical protein